MTLFLTREEVDPCDASFQSLLQEQYNSEESGILTTPQGQSHILLFSEAIPRANVPIS
jgi:hypothetical protein